MARTAGNVESETANSMHQPFALLSVGLPLPVLHFTVDHSHQPAPGALRGRMMAGPNHHPYLTSKSVSIWWCRQWSNASDFDCCYLLQFRLQILSHRMHAA